ncbi:MAG TPA: TIGR03118 family protein, partial [Candidatus Binataceae bacterium]|nr:TIGR03118 family protein [Candidatus Binataceae bacterium]
PSLPAGYAPFGIANIDGNLFVTYALQDADKHDDVAGGGHGYVDVFDTNGNPIAHFAGRGRLNSPWGIARAPLGFGKFAGAILIGNFGDGRINAFDPRSGKPLGQLPGTNGKPVTIDGLWGLSFGGATGSNPGTLYFTAGPGGESHGLFGSLEPGASPTSKPW